jgi:hypothetical protein
MFHRGDARHVYAVAGGAALGEVFWSLLALGGLARLNAGLPALQRFLGLHTASLDILMGLLISGLAAALWNYRPGKARLPQPLRWLRPLGDGGVGLAGSLLPHHFFPMFGLYLLLGQNLTTLQNATGLGYATALGLAAALTAGGTVAAWAAVIGLASLLDAHQPRRMAWVVRCFALATAAAGLVLLVQGLGMLLGHN